MRLAVVGSPAYFKSNTVPRRPQDLKEHSCIGFRFSNRLYRWEFEKGAGRRSRSASRACILRRSGPRHPSRAG
jgi:hypothetical protein